MKCIIKSVRICDFFTFAIQPIAVFKTHIFYSLVLVVSVLAAGCGSSKKLTSVLVETREGNTELIYAGSQIPENLVSEIVYYPNGDTLSITPMKKGSVHGVVTRYNKSNSLKEQITFADGKQDGMFRRFDEDGVLVFEGQLVGGKKTGTWTTWFDEVQKEEERSYSDDQPNGKWTYWYIDGSLKREETYKDGKLIDKKNYN